MCVCVCVYVCVCVWGGGGGGGCSVHVPIHVLSWDGQSISGSRDTLMGAVCMCPSMHCPGMVRVSWDLGIL